MDTSIHIVGFDEVHGEFGVEQWNIEEKLLLRFCLEQDICVSSTCCKREEGRKVTFRLGENRNKLILC